MPRARNLGGFEVRRALPARQSGGPLLFFDHMGRVELIDGRSLEVRVRIRTSDWRR